MASCWSEGSSAGRQKLVIATLALMAILTQIVTVTSLYIPQASHYNVILRRQDPDDEDIEPKTSASYQNQDDGGAGVANDGYEDNEPDGPYEETPREEEGQADLERFFDDHLGASEREGMDKENLPSNIVPVVALDPQTPIGFDPKVPLKIEASSDRKPAADYHTTSIASPDDKLLSQPSSSYPTNSEPNVETRYITSLPNNKLIITRQITTGPIYKGGQDISYIATGLPQLQHLQNLARTNERLTANGSDIVATEDEDMDRVYVTNITNKPFKIEALGGFDPEEDFKDASRDIEGNPKYNPSVSRGINGGRETRGKDISFNDPEVDMFEDASETDEVTFAHDPYQVDLEQEMRDQASNKQDSSSSLEPETEPDNTDESSPAKSYSDEDSEGSWINDGVDDMDIPSQEHQDSVLERAAKQDELARRIAQDDASQQQDKEQQTHDQGDQRMPNADYLKDDLKMDEMVNDDLDDASK